MSFAKTIEMSSESDQGFHDAVLRGVQRANKTLENVQGVWIKSEEVVIDQGEIRAYRANLKVTSQTRD